MEQNSKMLEAITRAAGEGGNKWWSNEQTSPIRRQAEAHMQTLQETRVPQ